MGSHQLRLHFVRDRRSAPRRGSRLVANRLPSGGLATAQHHEHQAYSRYGTDESGNRYHAVSSLKDHFNFITGSESMGTGNLPSRVRLNTCDWDSLSRSEPKDTRFELVP